MADKNARLIFNIGGQRHEAFISTLKAIPGTRLSWIADNYLLLQHSPAYDPDKNEFFFDRSPTAFISILNYYRTGQLHYPTNVCGPSFACELKFWGLDEAQMQSCCWEGFTANRDKDDKLKGFKGPHFQVDDDDDDVDDIAEEFGKHYVIRHKIWKFFDDAYSSRAAKVYSYIGYILLFIYILLPIIRSVLNQQQSGLQSEYMNAHVFHIQICELVLNIYFTIELIVRFVLCPKKKLFVKSRLNMADLMSLFPAYIEIILKNHPFYPRVSNYINILTVFRIVKVFRSFRYNYTLQVLVNTLKESLPELSLLVFLMLLLATVFAYASYFTEKDQKNTQFVSILRCLWWAFITMTTVGYGDMYPTSWLGQLLGIMAAICGLLMVALPVSVVATNFSIYYSYAKARISLPPKKKVTVAADANNFLGQNTIKDDEKKEKKKRNKVAPVKERHKNGALNGAPVGPRGNTLPPLDNSKFAKLHRAVESMKEQGMLKNKKKMDLATLVMVLSSKGDWEAPKD